MKESVKLKDPRTCRIFFSSPFGGMEEEREELTKKYFPQLHHACNAKGIRFVPVDMRWGITKEAAANAQVMNICLREVERSDYFVGFFGQRYGWHCKPGSEDSALMQNFDNAMMTYPWVDSYRDRSITEVEWRAGHLNTPGVMPSCFCFRDKEYDDAMCEQSDRVGRPFDKRKFTSENDYAFQMLQKLSQAVLDSQEKTYGVMTNYKTPQEGAKFIFKKIWYFVTEVVLNDVLEEEIPHTLKLRQVHDLFAQSKTNLYCGCSHYLETLNKKIDDEDCVGVVVKGPAGCGKSSFLATWIQSLQKQQPQLAIIYHFIGCSPGTERPKAILERLLLELKAAFPSHGPKTPEPDRGTPRNQDKEKEKSVTQNQADGDGAENSPATGVTTVNGEASLPAADSQAGPASGLANGDSSSKPTHNHDENSLKSVAEDRNGLQQDTKSGADDRNGLQTDSTKHRESSVEPGGGKEEVNGGLGPTESGDASLAQHDAKASTDHMPQENSNGPKGEQRDEHSSDNNQNPSGSSKTDSGNSDKIQNDSLDEKTEEKQSDDKKDEKSPDANKNSSDTSKEEKSSDDKKEESSSDAKKEESSSDAKKEESSSDDKKEESSSDDKKEESSSDDKKEESSSNDKKEENSSNDKKQENSSEAKKSNLLSGEEKDVKTAPTAKKTSQQLLSEVKALLKTLSENGEKVVIVIDALNQQQKREKTVKHLYWLPESFPKGVSFICSSLDVDSATQELLVQQRGMYALGIEPYNSHLQMEICVDSLKVSGKELSPNQLERIISSSETSNPLFLKLIIYELSIYGSFRKLDEKIDSLIYVNGVKPLLQVILCRLEEDYNSGEYAGSLVKDVLCCLIASKKGLSELEIIKILAIPSNAWSPLFFALEHLLVQYTGLLGFAFSEVYEAVYDRYLKDPSEITAYKRMLINYFDSTRLTMKPWEKNNGLEYNRVLEELPWLLQDIQDKDQLINTLSDISIMKKMMNANGNDLLELWQSTGLAWSAVTFRYMRAFDKALVNLYLENQEGVLDQEDSPGSLLRVTLQYLRTLFDLAYYPDGNLEAMKREIKILENCRSKYTPEKKAEYLRDSRYYLAVAYSDRQKYDQSLPLYNSLKEECEQILAEKEDSAAEELMAYVCNGMGLVYYGLQDYPKALILLRQSEGIHQKRNEKRHQAASTTNIGLVYLNQRRHHEALMTFEKAQKLYDDHFFGEMPLDVGNLLTNIALTYRRMKDLNKAEEFYHKSLEMKAKNVGWFHPVIAVAYMNLGTLEVHRKNYAKAEEWTRKSLHIYELNEVPVRDKSHRMCRENLCMNMLKQNKKQELVPLYLEVAHILVDHGWIGECIVPLHRDMLAFIMEMESARKPEVEKILLGILASPKRRACFAYQLATLDSGKQRDRPDNLTIQHFAKEYPSDSRIQIQYVTDFLAKSDQYDEIVSVCLALHDKEQDLKESAFSFAAEALNGFNFYASAKKILLLGLEKYPGHLELVNSLIECLLPLEEAEGLLPYVSAMLDASDWSLLSEDNLTACAEALEAIDVDTASKCYTKLIQDGSFLHKKKAEQAMARLSAKVNPSDTAVAS